MDTIISHILNKKITGLFHNYIEMSMSVFFEDTTELKFVECAIVMNSGIVGHEITFASTSGTLGLTLELKKLGRDPNDYLYFIMSRDIKDFNNKNELLICYKRIQLQSSQL